MKQLKKKKGFTLVELIVVIAIIAILAAVAVPTTMHFVEKAHESNDQVAINILENIKGYLAVNQCDISVQYRDNNDFLNALEGDAGAKSALKRINTITFYIDNTTGDLKATILAGAKGVGGNEAKTPQSVEGIVLTGIKASDVGMTDKTNLVYEMDAGTGKVKKIGGENVADDTPAP